MTIISTKTLHEMYIVVGTVLYAVSIVFAKEAMLLGMGPNSFNALQYIVGAILLVLTRPGLRKYTSGKDNESLMKPSEYIQRLRKVLPTSIANSANLELYILGFMCALPGFFAATVSQYGLVTVDAGKSAFLSSLYVIITPIIQYVIHGREANIHIYTWYSSGVCLFGSYLLSGASLDSITIGEIEIVIGAFLLAVEILFNDYSVQRVNCIDLTCVQMCFSMLFCCTTALLVEPEEMYALVSFTSSSLDIVFWSILLVLGGGIVEAVAYQLHVVGQLHTSGPRAALLMGLEAVATSLVAYAFLNEVLTTVELCGCALIFMSTLFVSTNEEAEEEDKSSDATEDDPTPCVLNEELMGAPEGTSGHDELSPIGVAVDPGVVESGGQVDDDYYHRHTWLMKLPRHTGIIHAGSDLKHHSSNGHPHSTGHIRSGITGKSTRLT